jgi:hypothetical protein
MGHEQEVAAECLEKFAEGVVAAITGGGQELVQPPMRIRPRSIRVVRVEHDPQGRQRGDCGNRSAERQCTGFLAVQRSATTASQRPRGDS